MALLQVDTRTATATESGIVPGHIIDWGDCLGPEIEFWTVDPVVTGSFGDNFGTVATCSTSGAIGFSIDQTPLGSETPFIFREDQGSAYSGDFPTGEELILRGLGGAAGGFEIIFGADIVGVGFFVQINQSVGGPVTDACSFTLYDSGLNVLGTFLRSISVSQITTLYLGAAYEAGGANNIRRVRVAQATRNATAFDFAIGQVDIGEYDPATATSPAPSSPSRCVISAPGTGTSFVLSRGVARHGRVLAEFARDELLVSDGSETLGLHLRTAVWRALGRGCTGLFYEADTDATVASFGTATYELEREGTLTDAGSGLVLAVETPGVASDAAVPMRLQRLYVEADTRGQSVVPTLVLDETTIVLAAFVTTARTTVEYALDVSARVAGVRLAGTTLADRVDVFGVDLDYYVPEGEPGASFTIPEAPMMVDA